MLAGPNAVSKTLAYDIHMGDAFLWLEGRADNSIHAILTDPPYGLKEYSESEKRKLRSGRGGVWRIPSLPPMAKTRHMRAWRLDGRLDQRRE
jgi:DNA modification methylase